MAQPPKRNPEEEYYTHIRRVKKVLRPLPRKASLHRYPVIKWFAEAARKRHYLWSFRKREVMTAIYVGCLLAFSPIWGLHAPVAFLLSFVFRANMAVMVGLQIFSNPLMVAPVTYASYKIGQWVFRYAHIPVETFHTVHEASGVEQLPHYTTSFMFGLKKGMHMFGEVLVGGAVIGLAVAVVLSLFYQLLYNYLHQRFVNMKLRKEKHQSEKNKTL
jgi:uncharacterized protein (DUF2062 family)